VLSHSCWLSSYIKDS